MSGEATRKHDIAGIVAVLPFKAFIPVILAS